MGQLIRFIGPGALVAGKATGKKEKEKQRTTARGRVPRRRRQPKTMQSPPFPVAYGCHHSGNSCFRLVCLTI